MERVHVMQASCSFSVSRLSNSTAAIFPARTSLQYPISVALASFSRLKYHTFHWHFEREIAFCNATTMGVLVESNTSEMKYIEVGKISCVHGVMGEIGVKPNTDFPELRFCKPGKRWLKRKLYGREIIREVELVEGREYPAKKIWVVKFSGFDALDLAKQLVGSTILVSEDDRPQMSAGQYYSYDFIGMKVILKESAELVGTVTHVYASGAHDLIEVMPDYSFGIKIGMRKPGAPEPCAYVPLVRPIVPVVDLTGRKMHIIPPEGLLEFYLLPQEETELDDQKLQKLQIKKFKRKLIDAKRKLYRMQQKHVFGGFKFGELVEQMGLAYDIIHMNFKLLQFVLKDIVKPSKRCYMSEFLTTNSAKLMGRRLRMSEMPPAPHGDAESADPNFNILQNALHLTSSGKTAIVLIATDFKRPAGMFSDLDGLESNVAQPFHCLRIDDLLSGKSFPKVEDRASIPLVVVCSGEDVGRIEEHFSMNNHFFFDSEKVWFVEEEKMPAISHLIKGKRMHKILMLSPWKILLLPVGSGGVISLLSLGITEYFEEIGVEYIEVYSLRKECVQQRQMLLGFASYRGADLGIQISVRSDNYEENVAMVFSMRFMKELTRKTTPTKLKVDVVSETHPHAELVGDEWKEVIPSAPNSYALSYSIYSCLNACSLDKVCILEIAK